MAHYQVEIHASPAKESYEIGSQVTLNCIATPLPQKHYNFTFPVINYQWHSSGRRFINNYFRGSSISFEIGAHQQTVVEYFCSIYGYSIFNGRLLGKGRITLTIEGINNYV